MDTKKHPPRFLLPYLLLTAILCGALVMVVEVLGSRVVGPFFGVSLFVWTSLITVTLIALAGGYAAGGILADRYGQAAWLFGLVFLAGVLVLLVPVLKGPVLQACVPLGLRAGAFVSTLVLFGPALFLLGCVSPYLVRLTAREMHNLGRVVGNLYALSTLGSVAGTVLTGFVLIAYLGISAIFTLVGLVLVALAAGYFVFFERRWWAAAAVLIPLLLHTQPDAFSKIGPDGTSITQVFKEESAYGTVQVVDYRHGEKHIRELMIDGMIQGGHDVTRGLALHDYAYHIQYVSHMLHPAGTECLIIGLGAGDLPRWFERNGKRCDVVEINPTVAEVARDYFDLDISGAVHIQDARYFLANSLKRYDYIVLDVCTGDITPGHVMTREALSLVQARLAEGGVLAVNVIGSILEDSYVTASIVRTLESVFDQVEIYPSFSLADAPDGVGNLAVMAYRGEPRALQWAALPQLEIHPFVEARVRNTLGTRFEFPNDAPAMVLTDDYNPMDHYDSWLREKVRLRTLNLVDWGLLAS